VKLGWSAEQLQEALAAANLTASVGVKKSRAKATEGKPKTKKIVLPYSNGCYKAGLCDGLRANNGLYTQCTNTKPADCAFCKVCKKVAESTPDQFQTIQDRSAVDAFEFYAKKGDKLVKPSSYFKYMQKSKLTPEQVLAAAVNQGIPVDERHFVEPPASKRGKKAATTTEKAATSEPVVVPLVVPTSNPITCPIDDEYSHLREKDADDNDDDDDEEPELDDDEDEDEPEPEKLGVPGFEPVGFDYTMGKKKTTMDDVKLFQTPDIKTGIIWVFARSEDEKKCSKFPIGQQMDDGKIAKIEHTFELVRTKQMEYVQCKVLAAIKKAK
jgi:hypothetical protein